jgi:hypothetical protein
MRSLATLVVLILAFHLSAQVYDHPNYSLTSHPTLAIISVERWDDQMVLTLSLKNERYSGEFCIDSNTVLRNSLGKDEYKLVSMEGITACPEVYRFKTIGERITIILEFPAIPDDVNYIDLIENCDENCVALKYILLDEELNSSLNEGIRLYELGKPDASLQVFEDLLRTEYDDFSPVFGTVYLYLIAIQYELGSSKDAREVFQKLKDSNIVGRDEFIEAARETGIVR